MLGKYAQVSVEERRLEQVEALEDVVLAYVERHVESLHVHVELEEIDEGAEVALVHGLYGHGERDVLVEIVAVCVELLEQLSLPLVRRRSVHLHYIRLIFCCCFCCCIYLKVI